MGKSINELEELVDLPDSMVYVWRYFIDLHNARTSNGYGINPITYSDIMAYFSLNHIEPLEWEITIIKQLDVLAMKIHQEESEKEAKKRSKTKTKPS